MRKISIQALSLLLALAVPVSMFGADNAAMLYPQGKVLINGTPAMRATTLFSGDSVRTGEQGQVMLSMAGSTVQVTSQSEVQYDGSSLHVATGSALINTQRGLKAQLSNLVVTPENNKARFNLGQRNQKVVVAALEGAVRVSDGQNEMLLQPGKAILFAVPKEAKDKDDKDKDKNDERASRRKAGTATVGGAAPLLLSNAAAIGITAGAAALAATTALILNNEVTPTPASPVQ